MSSRQNNTILHAIILISDLMGSGVALMISYLIRYGVIYGTKETFDQAWVLIVVLLSTLIVNIIVSPTKQFTTRGCFAELLDILKRQFFTIITAISILYLAHIASDLSRLVALYYAVLSIVIMWLLRIAIKWYLVNVKTAQDASSRILIVATIDKAENLAKKIESSHDFDRIVCNYIAIKNDDYGEALEYVTRHEVDEVFVSINNDEDDIAYKQFLTDLVNMRLKVDIDINQFELDVPGSKGIDQVGEYAVVTIAINLPSISRRVVKRMADIAGALIGIVLFIIAFVIFGPIIKIDSEGPIIFSQDRVGKNGRVFRFHKFRSMCSDAEAKKALLMEENEVEGYMFKMEDDPRITKIGKFIRRTSIDELPQFWNVLIGDMSLVGTRPPTVDEYNRYESWQKARLSMKPGITGLWQVSGRSDIRNFDDVVRLDVEYIDNWSFSLDIKILLKTIGVVFTGKGSR